MRLLKYAGKSLLVSRRISTIAARSPPDAAREVVDYLLFVDEAPIANPINGSTAFATQFAARGPHDRLGRSLRQLDLTRRLLRYPCSYMIYGEQFDRLPADAKEAIYRRMWEILSGKDPSKKYSRLARASLGTIATAGGGQYLEIDRESDREIAVEIINAARSRAGSRVEETTEDLYWRFLAAAACLLALGILFLKERAEMWIVLAAGGAIAGIVLARI